MVPQSDSRFCALSEFPHVRSGFLHHTGSLEYRTLYLFGNGAYSYRVHALHLSSLSSVTLSRSHKPVLILGAGLAGVSTAYHLKKFPYVLIEKESEVGGTARSFEIN